jgi:DNA-binding response OmpR family regulator
LIIEDGPDLRSYLTGAVQQDGYAVEAVGDAETALTSLDTHFTDIAITDVMLPGPGGSTCSSRCGKTADWLGCGRHC